MRGTFTEFYSLKICFRHVRPYSWNPANMDVNLDGSTGQGSSVQTYTRTEPTTNMEESMLGCFKGAGFIWTNIHKKQMNNKSVWPT